MSEHLGKPVDFKRNPVDLPPGFEIRRLGLEHVEWTKAIVGYSNIFHSPIWPKLYPDNKKARMHDVLITADHLCRHQIESGLSFGIFETNYKFKRPESKATGGALYFDKDDGVAEDQLADQMDFPLVSIALAYDLIDDLDPSKIMPLMGTLPLFGEALYIQGVRAEEDSNPNRDANKKPDAPRQVLQRMSTCTREGYEGKGLMTKLAQFLMREAKFEGFERIRIDAFSDSVSKVFLNPPAPFSAILVSRLNMGTFPNDWPLQDDEGKLNGAATEKLTAPNQFTPATQLLDKIVVHLN